MTTETQQLQEQVAKLTEQLNWLNAQVTNLYTRMQMPFVSVNQVAAQHARTETGMGPITSADRTSFL